MEFKEKWLEAFYEEDQGHRLIARNIENTLYRKIQILDAAQEEADLRIPPGNHFEHLSGNLKDWRSIRVNRQYRLIFQWVDGIVINAYLDPHKY